MFIFDDFVCEYNDGVKTLLESIVEEQNRFKHLEEGVAMSSCRRVC